MSEVVSRERPPRSLRAVSRAGFVLSTLNAVATAREQTRALSEGDMCNSVMGGDYLTKQCPQDLQDPGRVITCAPPCSLGLSSCQPLVCVRINPTLTVARAAT